VALLRSAAAGTVLARLRTIAWPLDMRMRQSINQFEVAFEQETTLERRRREQLRRRAANRSRERRIARNEQHGKVRFSVLAVCLTATVAVVVVSMFEALSFLMA
jgi:hypothetical protein